MSGRIVAHSNLIEVRQGDSFNIIVQIKKSHHDFDMQGSSLRMQVRDYEDNLLIDKTALNAETDTGKMVFILTPQDTNIPVGDYKVDIELVLPDGAINTIFPTNINKIGVFRITEQVTR
ncbi:MAG: hypothetical protein IJV97_03160 [Alphaproteobacteria bacterium]|nr:hypothetical protein [Alphaproteobacteria bacterium]